MRIPSNKISDVVRFFRDELKEQYDKDELETLISYCFEEFINVKRNEIPLKGNDTISESELLKFNFAVKDLNNNKPIQHILGKADFYGSKFIVNENVLIPRQETEELVDLIIKEHLEDRREKLESRIKNQESGIKTKDSRQVTILDIGTGSGCIPIILKKKIPSVKIYAIDISEKALEIAKANEKLNEVDIEFIQHDILSDKPLPFEIKFDVIVSNPPYVRNLEKKHMHKNVLDFEPHLALFVSDEDPLIFYKVIADYAIANFKTDGKLYFEINEYLANETMQMLLNKGFKNVEVFADINGKNRILRCNS